MKQLVGAENCIELYDIIQYPESDHPVLVMEYVSRLDDSSRMEMEEEDIKHYIYGVLKGIDSSNARGIMHRDIKPPNIAFDPITKIVRLIDWGLAEFYHPKKKYNVSVASRYYKAPELLIGIKDYNYSLDIWSVGCILASFVFKYNILFKGKDNHD